MKIINMPIVDIIPYKNNPRKNEQGIEAVAKSIEEYSIYAIYNSVNGKIYIGQTKQSYQTRFKQHLQKSSGCPLLRRAIDKHEEKAFHIELLDTAYDRATANEKEKMWIYLLEVYKEEHGYNLLMGGVIGDFNRATLKKMSESKKGNKNSFYGRKHTKEAKIKMSKWKKENYHRENHPGAKKVRCVETGKTYNCVLDASEDTGASAKHIGSVANGRYGRKTAGGYKWEWVE